MKVTASLKFSRYIGHPYWPERERLINIQKESGVNRARSQEHRQKTLDAYLQARDISMEGYLALEERAQRQFYTWQDVATGEELRGSGHKPSEIVISAHQLYGCLAQTCSLAPSSIRLVKPEQLRTVLTIGDFFTGKYRADGTWERFVVVKLGTGNKLSNQRALRSNEYISDFTATGEIRFINGELEAKVRNLVEFAGREIGVGASRKMGYGRFTIAEWKQAV